MTASNGSPTSSRWSVGGLIAAAAIVCAVAAPPSASAQQREIVIEGPNGGDCAAKSGAWTGATCVLSSLVVSPNENLIIRRGAYLIVRTEFINNGNTFVLAGEPSGTAHLILGSGPGASGTAVNNGTLGIRPKAGVSSPSLSNFIHLTNNGVIYNMNIGGAGGTIINVGTINNSNKMVNDGLFQNSGPPKVAVKATVTNLGNGTLDTQRGTLENIGTIRGKVFGTCPGDCS